MSYTPNPTGAPSSSSAQTVNPGATTTTTSTTAYDNARTVEYTCGECDATVPLKRGEPIRCRQCGHRVLYKKRTNRMVQFEAR